MKNYELNKHKKSDKIKWIATAVAFGLLFIFIAGLCMQLFGKGKLQPSNWFKKTEQTTPATPEEKDNGGAVITDTENTTDGVSINSKKLLRSEFEENGISAQAETAFTLTAIVLPEEAFDKSVDWSVAWQNSGSSWASGKNVNDYYSITPTSDGSCTANAVCKQAFAEPVIIKCKLRNADIYATVKADYLAKLLDIEFNAPPYELGNYGSYEFLYRANYSIGTITNGTLTFKSLFLSFPSEFGELVSNTYSSAPDGLFDDYFGNDIIYDADEIYPYGSAQTEGFSPYWTDIMQVPSDISTSDRLRAMDIFHKAVYDKYGNGVKRNFLTYTLNYTYTIDGQTVTGEKEYPAHLDIDIYIVANSVSVNQTQIKH